MAASLEVTGSALGLLNSINTFEALAYKRWGLSPIRAFPLYLPKLSSEIIIAPAVDLAKSGKKLSRKIKLS